MAKTGHNGHNGHGPDHRGHVSEVPDVSYIKNIDVTHETSDVSVSGLLKFVVALSVMTAMVALLMWGLFRFFMQQEEKKEPPKGFPTLPIGTKPLTTKHAHNSTARETTSAHR